MPDRQDRRPLDGGACADEDVRFAMTPKALHLDVEHVRSRRQGREAQFPILVRLRGLAPPISAGELIRTTAPERTPPCCVLDGSDEGSRQSLRGSHRWKQETGDRTPGVRAV